VSKPPNHSFISLCFCFFSILDFQLKMAQLPPPYQPQPSLDVEQHFQRFDNRKPISLGDEYLAVPIWQIQRRTKPSRAEIAQGSMLNNWWSVKGQTNPQFPQAQRCPFISVDNVCFLFTRDMYNRGVEPHLILGLWDKKNVEIYGTKQDVKGLVLAGGGHYERMANKKARPGRTVDFGVPNFEEGDISLLDAADKELREEIGIDKKNVRMTRELGLLDDFLSEPRAHYVRFAFLRWIEQPPKTSDELKTVIALPVSQLKGLCDRSETWKNARGEEFSLELNHDKLIKLILAHPETQAFLANIATVYEVPKARSSTFTPMTFN